MTLLSLDIELLENMGNAADPWAEAALGFLHEIGGGTAKDLRLAGEWYGRSAGRGCDFANYCLLEMQLERREQAAREAVMRSAESGYPLAQTALATIYLLGRGGPRNLRAAYKWVKASADQGYVPSLRLIALMLLDGEGTTADLNLAKEYLRQAAELGSADASHTLAGILIYQDKDKNPKEALRLLKFAASNGVFYSLLELATAYNKGSHGLSRDSDLSIFLLSLCDGEEELR